MRELVRLGGIGLVGFVCLARGWGGAEPRSSRVPDAAAFEVARAYHDEFGGQALVVMRDGEVLFEAYGNGGAPDKPQMLASGSKSFVGVAAVAAVEDGLIRLDDLACEALTEWKDDPKKSKITYRQLLTLTSGLTAGERGAAVAGPGWGQIVAKPMAGEPGARFEYGAYHLNAFAFALQKRLKDANFEAYLKRRILDPLGIDVEWRFRCADGQPQVGGGAFMTARDWATFGEFMRRGGEWKGERIVAEDLLEECLKGTKQNPAYGLTWWLREPVPADILRSIPILQRDMGDIVTSDWLPDDLYLAAGAGKQRLYIIPSVKLVMARMGDLRKGTRFRGVEFLDHLLRGRGEGEGTGETAAVDGLMGRGGREDLKKRLMESRGRKADGDVLAERRRSGVRRSPCRMARG